MSRSFNTPSAKPTFDSLTQQLDSSEYTKKIKNKTILCGINYCQKPKNINWRFNSQQNYLNAYQLEVIKSAGIFGDYNKLNLETNLLTYLDLSNVCVIENSKTEICPTTIDLNVVPYLTYTIDPNGQLFGNTYCGANNYLNYLKFLPIK